MKLFLIGMFFVALIGVFLLTIGGDLLALRLVEARASLAQAEAGRLSAAADLARSEALRVMAQTNQNQSAALSTLALLAIGWAFVLSLALLAVVVLAIRQPRQRGELPPAQIVYLPGPPMQQPIPEAWQVDRQKVTYE